MKFYMYQPEEFYSLFPELRDIVCGSDDLHINSWKTILKHQLTAFPLL